MRNKKMVFWLVGIAAFLIVGFVVAQPYLAQYNVQVDPNQASSKQVICQVQVKNPVGLPLVKNGDLIIESVNCQQYFVNFCAPKFGFASDKGYLRISAPGGIGTSVDLDIGEGSSRMGELEWCGLKSTSDFKINLYD